MKHLIIPTMDANKIYLAILIFCSLFLFAVLPPSKMYDISPNIENQLKQDSILLESTRVNQLHYLSTLADSNIEERQNRLLFDDSITAEARQRIYYYDNR
jgi:hypothetical protein